MLSRHSSSFGRRTLKGSFPFPPSSRAKMTTPCWWGVCARARVRVAQHGMSVLNAFVDIRGANARRCTGIARSRSHAQTRAHGATQVDLHGMSALTSVVAVEFALAFNKPGKHLVLVTGRSVLPSPRPRARVN